MYYESIPTLSHALERPGQCKIVVLYADWSTHHVFFQITMFLVDYAELYPIPIVKHSGCSQCKIFLDDCCTVAPAQEVNCALADVRLCRLYYVTEYLAPTNG